MKLTALVYLAICIVLAFASDSAIETRIVRGQNAIPGQFPYQASLRTVLSRTHFCGASIISNRFLLTAAHCNSGFRRIPYFIVVVVGAVHRRFDGVAYRIDKIMRHQYFSTFGLLNDISLIRTAKEIVFTANIQPIALPKQNVAANTSVVASGWGMTKPSNIFAAFNLHYADERTLSHDDCVKLVGSSEARYIHPKYMLCSMAKDVGAGICFGDSG